VNRNFKFQTAACITHLVEGSMSEPTATGAFLAVGVVGTA